jgi:hypothetical protein
VPFNGLAGDTWFVVVVKGTIIVRAILIYPNDIPGVEHDACAARGRKRGPGRRDGARRDNALYFEP